MVDAAHLLGVNRETLRVWMRTIAGFPRPIIVRNRPYLLANELDEWIAQQRRGGPTDAA
jgi:hypothetical protein